MTFCRSKYVNKVMKLLAFIFEQPSYYIAKASNNGADIRNASLRICAHFAEFPHDAVSQIKKQPSLKKKNRYSYQKVTSKSILHNKIVLTFKENDS